MCYDMIKCEDIDKHWLVHGLRYVIMLEIYSHIQMKLVDKGMDHQRRISFEKWTFYQEEIEGE